MELALAAISSQVRDSPIMPSDKLMTVTVSVTEVTTLKTWSLTGTLTAEPALTQLKEVIKKNEDNKE